jgi:hypothetical protein
MKNGRLKKVRIDKPALTMLPLGYSTLLPSLNSIITARNPHHSLEVRPQVQVEVSALIPLAAEQIPELHFSLILKVHQSWECLVKGQALAFMVRENDPGLLSLEAGILLTVVRKDLCHHAGRRLSIHFGKAMKTRSLQRDHTIGVGGATFSL